MSRFINNHGGFGSWAFLEIVDPWDAKKAIREFLNGYKVDGVELIFRNEGVSLFQRQPAGCQV